MHEHVREGILPEKIPTPQTNNLLIGAVANPVNLNLMFEHIPRRVHLSLLFVGELLLPELTLEAISPSTLLSLGTQTATRVSCVNTLANVSFDPAMNDEIAAWFLSLLMPGAILFNIDMDDLGADDSYTRCLAGLAAKLLLSYSNEPRWNSITPRTLHLVEQTIVNAGTEAGIIEGARGQGVNPLDRVVPVPQARLTRFDLLRTTENGGGWRNGEEWRDMVFLPLQYLIYIVNVGSFKLLT
ncbi:unnamed protein product [Chilo suppressalis]|uniref:Uncharacterized protein n=1 Tax=Chilo suppressalis TaxID=168631 RepID=A0ABN8B4K7_CHISP|nr:unnamed protein product [Chilo suppressalis]